MKKTNKLTGLAVFPLVLLTMLTITACGNAKTDGLAEAKAMLADAKKITVTAPTKDTWFAKNLAEEAKGKLVSVRVNATAEDETIYVEKKDGSAALICPVGDGQASVVTDKDTVAQYKPKAQPTAETGAQPAPASPGGTASWKVKNKVVTRGMSKDEVKKLIGNPGADTLTSNEWRYDNRNGFLDMGGIKVWILTFQNSKLSTVTETKDAGMIPGL